MKKKIYNSFLIFFILIICLFMIYFCLLVIQKDMFFHPWHDEKSYTQLLNKNDFEEIKINNNNNQLHGWFKYNTKEENAPLLIFFAGNAQNSSHTCIYFLEKNIYKYFENYNFLIVDYPGYGLSDGTPSDKTMFDAALKIYDYSSNLEHVQNNKIVVLGYSIGTGVATYVASQRDVSGLILISPYDQALSLYNDTLNIFYGPLKLLAKYKFDSISYAPKISVSPLIITSYDDEVINYNFSLNLANYFKNVEKTILLKNIAHSDYFYNETVLNSIYDYLQNLL